MGKKITLNVDHYELVSEDLKITAASGVLTKPLVLPILTAAPTVENTSQSYDSILFTGNVNSSYEILCFGNDNNHLSGDVEKVIGHRVTDWSSSMTFTSPKNALVEEGQPCIIYSKNVFLRNDWGITMYDKSVAGSSKTAKHFTNPVYFDSNGYGLDRNGGYPQINISVNDLLCILCRYNTYLYIVRFYLNTTSAGDIELIVHYDPSEEHGGSTDFTVGGATSSHNFVEALLISGIEYKPGGGGDGGDPGQTGGQTESNPGGFFFGGSSDGAGKGGIGGDGKTWEFNGKVTDAPLFDGLNDFKLQSTIGGDGTFKSIHKGEAEEGFLPSNTIDISDSQFLHIYDMTGSMGLLLQKIWTQDAQEALKQYFAGDIGNCILSVYHTRKLGINKTSRNVKLGQYDTGITATEMKQYAKHKVCTFTLNRFYGSQWDYETQCYIYLPYIGFQELSMDKYMPRKTSDKAIQSDCKIEVWECLDLLSGSILYFLKRVEGDFSCVLDTFSGSFKSDIPITTAQHSSMISGLISQYGGIASQAIGWAGLVSSIAATIATGGGASAVSVPAMAQSAAMIAGGVAAQMSGTQAACRSTFKTTGGVGGGLGAMGGQRVFITYMRPAVYQTYEKSHYIGYLNKQTVTIKNLPKGKYFKFSTAILKGAIPAEMQERILKQLQTGVYI